MTDGRDGMTDEDGRTDSGRDYSGRDYSGSSSSSSDGEMSNRAPQTGAAEAGDREAEDAADTEDAPQKRLTIRCDTISLGNTSGVGEAGPLLCLLTLIGDMDAYGVPLLRSEVERACEASQCVGIVLDVAGVGFIDSTGLATLLEIRRKARTAGRALALASLPPQFVRKLQLASLLRLFSVYPSAESAAQALLSPALSSAPRKG